MLGNRIVAAAAGFVGSALRVIDLQERLEAGNALVDAFAASGALALSLRDPNAVQLDATVDWPDIEVRSVELAFPGAYQRYLESIAAAWDLDGLQVTGSRQSHLTLFGFYAFPILHL